MKEKLSHKQIEYILFHLNQHVELSNELKKTFAFGDDIDGARVFFPLSDKEISPAKVEFKGESLSIIYPLEQTTQPYSIKEGKLYFHHDFLKSAFYLLSAYQEVDSKHVDAMGRFKFDGSIQERLGCVTKPLVNYYFEIIIDGLVHWGREVGQEIKRKRLFDNFGFMLTHDVDRIDYYHWRETIYKWMQVVGLKPAHFDKKRLFKSAYNAIIPTLFPGFKADPWWNFKELRQLERQHGIKSVWYFLNKDGSPHDAKYHLEEKRITNLIAYLQQEDCEVGLHGSIQTAMDLSSMQQAYNRVGKASKEKVVGTRQHFLKFHYPDTLKIQESVGLKYDTSMGYAEHEGFRNSYCYPFKPFDHESDQMMDIWEFPLVVMDTTLFGYRKLKYNEMKQSINLLIDEVSKFGGLFVMLWHNCNFDEYQYPGIQEFYKETLTQIAAAKQVSHTGVEVLGMLEGE